MLKIDKVKLKMIAKELLIGMALIFLFSTVISYLRKPTLDSTQLPEQTVTLIEGSEYKIEKGKPLLVHFWATWCPTCKLEASNIESVSKDYHVLSIAVNSGTDNTLRAYMNEKGLVFRVLNDTHGKWAKTFKVEAYPTSFIYNSAGELSFTEVGYTTTAGLLARLKMAE